MRAMLNAATEVIQRDVRSGLTSIRAAYGARCKSYFQKSKWWLNLIERYVCLGRNRQEGASILTRENQKCLFLS